MPPDLSRSGYRDGLPGHKEGTTSLEAAQALHGTAEALRERVYRLVLAAGAAGVGPDEAAGILGQDKLNIRPRFSELKKAGLIEKAGRRVRTESGNPQQAWRAV